MRRPQFPVRLLAPLVIALRISLPALHASAQSRTSATATQSHLPAVYVVPALRSSDIAARLTPAETPHPGARFHLGTYGIASGVAHQEQYHGAGAAPPALPRTRSPPPGR